MKKGEGLDVKENKRERGKKENTEQRNKAQLDEIMYKLYEAGDHKGVET